MQSGKILPHQLLQESIQSNKQNHQQNFSQDITHGRIFSSNLVNSQDARHKTTFSQRRVFDEKRTSKTTINVHKSLKRISKLDDIYFDEMIVSSNVVEKADDAKNLPLNVMINKNEEKKDYHTIENSFILSGKEKSQKEIKEKSQLVIKQKDENNNILELENQTPTALLKVQLKESDSNNKPFHLTQKTKTINTEAFNIPLIIEDCQHVFQPIRKSETIRHVFNRHQSCAFSQPVIFHLSEKTNETLLSQKVSRFFYSEFKIFINKEGQQHELGTLKSNFTGSIYNFYPKGSQVIYFSIIFQKSKSSQNSQNLRHCQIYLNQGIQSSQDQNCPTLPFKKMESLEGLYLLNNQQNNLNTQILKFHSKQPIWSKEHQCYEMKFGSNSIFPSVKNTVFVDEKEKQVMKFYKNTHLTYNVSFQNPFSWIVAYGFALASTDFKIVTE